MGLRETASPFGRLRNIAFRGKLNSLRIKVTCWSMRQSAALFSDGEAHNDDRAGLASCKARAARPFLVDEVTLM